MGWEMNPPTYRNNRKLGMCICWTLREHSHYFLRTFPTWHTPSFSQWLQMCVKHQLFSSDVINENIFRLSQALAQKTYTYEKMWAYGNHYCVDVESGPWHLRYDYGVACIFRQANRSSTWDWNFVMGNLNYVKVLKENLVVDYASLPMVLFACSLQIHKAM